MDALTEEILLSIKTLENASNALSEGSSEINSLKSHLLNIISDQLFPTLEYFN